MVKSKAAVVQKRQSLPRKSKETKYPTSSADYEFEPDAISNDFRVKSKGSRKKKKLEETDNEAENIFIDPMFLVHALEHRTEQSKKYQRDLVYPIHPMIFGQEGNIEHYARVMNSIRDTKCTQ